MTLDDQLRIEAVKAVYAAELEQQKSNASINLELEKARLAQIPVLVTAAASYANAALRGLFLVNGAAIIATLTLIGNAGKDEAFLWLSIVGLVNSLYYFSIGIGLALVASCGAYLAQVCLIELSPHPEWKPFGTRLRAVSIIFAVSSLVLFLIGAAVSAAALSKAATSIGYLRSSV